MNKRHLPALLCATVMGGATLVSPVSAGTPISVKMECPIGGEKFTFWTTGSYSIFGSRPDGKPYGSWEFPLAMPECPRNKLVLYRDFEKDELPGVEALIASPEYRALAHETTYYRAQWLADRLDGKTDGPWLLLNATWQADGDPERKVRYQRDFADRATRVNIEPDDFGSLVLRYRLANAYRELGQFAQAQAALDTIPLPALQVQRSELDTADYEAVEEAESRRHLAEQVPLLAEHIARGDTSSEPFRMIPESIAIAQCAQLLESGQDEIDDFCRDEARQQAIEETREWLRQSKEMAN